MKPAQIFTAIALLALVAGVLFSQLSVKDEHRHTATNIALPLDLATNGECEACAMYVLEQPGPRGQLVYRDGSRRYFCSIGDLLAILTLPSPLGEPRQIWIEAMPADMVLADNNTEPQLWIKVNQAHFVVGIERRGVMGMPAVSLASSEDAKIFIGRNGGELSDWDGIQLIHKEYLLRKQLPPG